MANTPRLRFTAAADGTFPAPAAGLDSNSAPRAVSPSRAVLMENFLPGAQGKIQQRGPLDTVTAALSSPNASPVSFLSWNGLVLVPRTTNVNKDVAEVSLPDMTVTNYAVGAAYGVLGATAELRSYGYGIDAFSGYIARWDPAANTITNLTTGPNASAGICSHLDRLWVLGGAPPGGGATTQNTLFWTDPGGAPTNVLTEWKDDITGLVNTIVLDENEVGSTLARCGRNLAIFTTTSIWLVTGNQPANFVARRVLSGLGSLRYANPLAADNGTYFFSDHGIHFFDGISVTEISQAIKSEYAVAVGQGSARRSMAFIGTDWIAVTMPSTFFKLYHIPSGSWTSIDCSASIMALYGIPVLVGTTGGTSWAFDGARVWALNASSNSFGVAYPSFVRPDAYPSGYTKGVDSGSGITTTAIPCRYWSRIMTLAEPFNRSQLRRLFVEYDLRAATTIAAGQGLYVSLYDSLGNQILAPVNLPQGTTTQRFAVDCFHEVTDLQLRIEYANTSAVNVTKLEVYDSWVEYTPTVQKHA